jgi:transmembrane sensor
MSAQESTPGKSDVTTREAAGWFVRIHADDVTTQELGAWQLWLAQCPENRRAFQSIEDVWRDAGDVQARPWPLPRELSDDRYTGPQPLEEWQRREGARGHTRGWARPLAAAAAIGVLALLSALVYRWQVAPQAVPDVSALATARAEEREISLSDGSKVTLGAQSQVDIELSRTARSVSIDSGEAFFKVAREQRPFVVHAGEGTIVAIGTAFNVRHLDGRVVVTVTEGRVKITEPHLATGSATGIVYVSAGEQIAYGAAARGPAVRSIDPSVAVSWREGKLKYLNEPLRFVVADVNRYTRKQIVIGEPAVGDLLYTGTILPGELDDWLASIRDAFPVEVRTEADTAVLVGVRPAAGDPK